MLSNRRQVQVFYETGKTAKTIKFALPRVGVLALIRKNFGKRFVKCKKGLQTVTAVLMLLLMLVALTGLMVAFANYNSSIQEQMNVERDRAQEQVAITQIGTNAQEITSIKIANTGQIEVKIRALYREKNGAAILLTDPSASIPPGTSVILDIAFLGLTVDPDSMFVAATERGTRSKGANELLFEQEQNPTGVDTSGLTIGPLMLTFNSLNWARVDKNGNVQGQWNETWVIPTGLCSWKVNLTNLDTKNRSLTINQNSGFTTSLVSSPVTTTWYLKATQHLLLWNQTQTITFLWDASRASPANANSNTKGVNNVFLTLFGNFSDGETYAQTIPFQAITIV